MSGPPGEDRPCPCGSGRPFRRCCALLMRAPQESDAPDGVLLVPGFISRQRCRRLIELADRQPASESRIAVETSDGGTANVLDATRVTQQIDVTRVEDHFVPLVRHVFMAQIDPYYGVTTERFEYPMVLKYGPGGHYEQHNDAENQDLETGEWVRRIDRDYSILLYLNDDFSGGGLRFGHFSYELQPQAGLLVAFPSGHPYEHQALPVRSGLRYVIVSWAAMRGTPRVGPAPPAAIYTDPAFDPGDGVTARRPQ